LTDARAGVHPAGNRDATAVRKLFQALKSVRLAVGLIAYLAVTGMLATLVPQGREAELYLAAYPRLVAEMVVWSSFSRFFTSLKFLLPSALFFVNLAVCSVDRFLREIRRPEKRRHGPDVLHLGLLLLVIGAVLSFSGRQTGSVMLAGLREVDITGLEAVVDPGYPLVVAAFALITVGVFFTFALKIGDMK
jgi:cytochrome c biogenesis protein ResB